MKKILLLSTVMMGCWVSLNANASDLGGNLDSQVENAKEVFNNYPQCDYAHPDYCYELIANGCGSSNYSYNSYGEESNSSYGTSGCAGNYNSYTSYHPNSSYNTYSSYTPSDQTYGYTYSEGQLKLRFHLEDAETQDGFVGLSNSANKIFYSPDLQRLFEPSSEVKTSN